MMGAVPPNIRIMALMMTRDAEPDNLPPGPMAFPFFTWYAQLPDTTPDYSLRNIPTIIACLARNVEVGLTEVAGRVESTYKGAPVTNP